MSNLTTKMTQTSIEITGKLPIFLKLLETLSNVKMDILTQRKKTFRNLVNRVGAWQNTDWLVFPLSIVQRHSIFFCRI